MSAHHREEVPQVDDVPPTYPDVAKEITCGPSTEKHLAAIRKYEDAGFTHLILIQIGPNQAAFFEAFQNELRQRLGA